MAFQQREGGNHMKVNSFNVNITSEQPDRLLAFYRDIVGLKPQPEFGEGALDAGGTSFFIDGHSETKGGAKEPQRALLNFFVDDLAAEQERLEGQGVKFIRTAGKEEWGGMISTFVDPDGNYGQLIEFKPEGAS
jgi:predicted enzyme related to lactoylglutathione lyase